MISHTINNLNENSTELFLNEFQLTELEERLEMVVANFHALAETSSCCTHCITISCYLNGGGK
jgi:hypothetical protein